jgi:hypothetical protein
MSKPCESNFMNPVSLGQGTSLAAQRAWLNFVAACQVFKVVELRLRFAHALPNDFNSGFGRDADVAVIEIYAACRRLKARCIFDGLTVPIELSPSALEFIAQFRRLLRIPPRVLGLHVR